MVIILILSGFVYFTTLGQLFSFQTVMNALRTLVFAILVSALTRWGATAASAPTATKLHGTSRCVLVSCFGSYQSLLVFGLISVTQLSDHFSEVKL